MLMSIKIQNWWRKNVSWEVSPWSKSYLSHGVALGLLSCPLSSCLQYRDNNVGKDGHSDTCGMIWTLEVLFELLLPFRQARGPNLLGSVPKGYWYKKTSSLNYIHLIFTSPENFALCSGLNLCVYQNANWNW